MSILFDLVFTHIEGIHCFYRLACYYLLFWIYLKVNPYCTLMDISGLSFLSLILTTERFNFLDVCGLDVYQYIICFAMYCVCVTIFWKIMTSFVSPMISPSGNSSQMNHFILSLYFVLYEWK